MNSLTETSSHHSRPRGAGLAYRFNIHEEILDHRHLIDLLEISTEDYIVRERRLGADSEQKLLHEALMAFPSVAHGISLSLGTVEETPPWVLESTRQFLAETGMEVFSEHLAFHRMDGNDLTMFLAMPFAEESVEWIAHNYWKARRELGRAFALENVTYHFAVPDCPLDEAEFFRRVAEKTDATFLLDVTNLFNNSQNHGYDVGDFLDRYPLERVSQMHLAGGFLTEEGKWEDSHSEPVMEPVWELYEEILRRTRAEIVILERDSKFHPFEQVVADVERARDLFWKNRDHSPETFPPFPASTPAEQKRSLVPGNSDFSGLRGFQQAMMARITSAEFRTFYDSDPRAAAETFGLVDERWRKRLAQSDPSSLERFAKSWEVVVQQDAEVQEEYENSEWAAWAERLEVAESGR